MGWLKKLKKKFKKATTIKVGKNSLLAKAGKAVEKGVSNVAKETGKGAMQTLAATKKAAVDVGREGLVGTGNVIAETGRGAGVKDIEKAGKNVTRETRKGADPFLGAAFDIGANIATSGGYGVAQTAGNALSKGDLSSLTSSKGLQDMALQAAASKFGIDPTMLAGAKAGLSALQGDVKGAALQGLGSFGGLNADQLKMASTGVSALTGDKKGLASGLASQFGAGDSAASALGSVAGGDIKGALLGKLAGATGLDPKMLEQVSKGKIDPMALAKASGVDSKLLGGAADKLGISSFTSSPEAQEMMNMGRSAGRVVQSADAYVKDAQNAALDAQTKAQSAYKIAKGDSFNAIAKKLGVTPEQLKAANPQIKDINKIAAGADLNIPGAISRSVAGAASSVTDKYLKDASGKTIMGPNNAPILNPDFNAEEYDKLQARRAELGEDAATYVPGQQLGEEKWTMDRVLGNIKREGGKALDQIKGGAGAVGGAVSGALGAAKDFAAENKTGLELAADAAASYAGYRAGQESLGEAEDLQKKQLRDLQAQGAKFEGMSYDPTRYKQQQEMLDQSIAGGGRSALTRQLATESDMEAGRAEAAARASALQKLAETGGGAGIGGGAFLQSAFSGAAAGAGARGKAGLERATIAEKQYREDIARKTDLSRQQTQEEADLARQQGVFGLDKTQQVGGVRTTLGNIELDRGRALQNMYTQGAEMAKTALGTLQTPEEKARADANAKYQAEMRELDLEKKRQEVYGKPQQQTPPPPSPEKVAGAKQVSQGTGVVQAAPVQQAPKTSAGQFNATYSGPMARPAENQQPQNPMQQMQSTIGGFVNQAKANPQQAVQTVQKKVEEVKKDPVKAVTGMFGQWMGK